MSVYDKSVSHLNGKDLVTTTPHKWLIGLNRNCEDIFLKVSSCAPARSHAHTTFSLVILCFIVSYIFVADIIKA